MKQLAIVALLILASCNNSVRGGKIIGKTTRVYQGVIEDRIYYMLELERDGSTGMIEVTERAWNQATKGMEWPFEVK
jgi:hypothetical protein